MSNLEKINKSSNRWQKSRKRGKTAIFKAKKVACLRALL
jgi:hypothetical protein